MTGRSHGTSGSSWSASRSVEMPGPPSPRRPRSRSPGTGSGRGRTPGGASGRSGPPRPRSPAAVDADATAEVRRSGTIRSWTRTLRSASTRSASARCPSVSCADSSSTVRRKWMPPRSKSEAPRLAKAASVALAREPDERGRDRGRNMIAEDRQQRLERLHEPAGSPHEHVLRQQVSEDEQDRAEQERVQDLPRESSPAGRDLVRRSGRRSGERVVRDVRRERGARRRAVAGFATIARSRARGPVALRGAHLEPHALERVEAGLQAGEDRRHDEQEDEREEDRRSRPALHLGLVVADHQPVGPLPAHRGDLDRHPARTRRGRPSSGTRSSVGRHESADGRDPAPDRTGADDPPERVDRERRVDDEHAAARPRARAPSGPPTRRRGRRPPTRPGPPA